MLLEKGKTFSIENYGVNGCGRRVVIKAQGYDDLERFMSQGFIKKNLKNMEAGKIHRLVTILPIDIHICKARMEDFINEYTVMYTVRDGRTSIADLTVKIVTSESVTGEQKILSITPLNFKYEVIEVNGLKYKCMKRYGSQGIVIRNSEIKSK